MAITSVTPASGTLIEWGDSVSFDVDDTYTSMVIKVQTSTALVKAYDTALSGAQAGYTVSVEDDGVGTHTFTIASDAGWDNSPQLIYVTEDETGSSTTTNLSYSLSAEAPYPNNTEPYNSSSESDLVLSFKARTGAVVPLLSDYDASQIDNDSSVSGATVKDALETLDATYTTDHGGLGGLTDDDHSQYWLAAGTRVGDALYFTERSDHVNTPGAGKGELWVKDTVPCALYFTDDAGTDWNVMTLGSGDVTGPASSVDKTLAMYNGTTGKIIQEATGVTWVSPELYLDVANATLVMKESSTPPSMSSTYGSYWVKDDIPSSAAFTGDDSVDIDLARHQATITATINTNGTVNQWYTWDSNGPHHDALWSNALGGTSSTPSLSTTIFSYPPWLVLPRGAQIEECTVWLWNPDTGAVAHTLEIYVMGQALVAGASTAGTSYTHCTLSSTPVGITTPKWLNYDLVVNDASINADEGLYIFVREETGSASRVDLRMHMTLTYKILVP